MADISDIHGLPPLPSCFSVLVSTERTISESSQGEVQEGTAHCLTPNNRVDAEIDDSVFTAGAPPNGLPVEEKTEVASPNFSEVASPNFSEMPFTSLNYSLQKLKSEMAGLRKLDVSLLYQLWTLHEAIQEYKHVMQDTGSEYSYALSSRAGSMTSIDSCDLLDDYYQHSDPSLFSSLQGSTTSLIQQIEDLKVRAETEF